MSQRFHIRVNPDEVVGIVPKLISDVGYDEIRATLDPLGQEVFRLVEESNTLSSSRAGLLELPSHSEHQAEPGERKYRTFQEHPAKVFRHVRLHNMFTGSGGDRQGAKNAGLVDVRLDGGHLECDFTRLDAVYDTFLQAGCFPFVELGFMPPALALASKEAHAIPRDLVRLDLLDLDPVEDTTEEANWICNSPLLSYELWENLIWQTILHLQERYGISQIRDWYFELWNEPDGLGFWAGTSEEYCELYARTARVIKDIDASLRVGGPAMARSRDFLRAFLTFVSDRHIPIDFVSFHCKGGRPSDDLPYPQTERMLAEIKGFVAVMDASSIRVPVLVNEADPFLACVNGILDDPAYRFRETTQYPAIVAKLFYEILEYLEHEAPPWLEIHGVFSDNFHMIDEQWPFGGYRHVTTCVPVIPGVEHPAVVRPDLVGKGSSGLYKYGSLFPRDDLFRSCPMHPAYQSPYVIAKKPVFHIYPLFQCLGSQRIKVVTPAIGEETGHSFGLIATREDSPKGLIFLFFFVDQNVDVAGDPVDLEFTIKRSEFFPVRTGDDLDIRVCEISPLTCNLFEKWKSRWEELDGVGLREINEILRQNQLHWDSCSISFSVEDLHLDLTIPLNAVVFVQISEKK